MAEANAKKYRSGIVFGKFYPLTRGHQLLIETALEQCDRVLISASQRPSETIPGAVRAEWIRRLYPEARTVLMRPDLPYLISECASPDAFYRIWQKALAEISEEWPGFGRPEVCFTSEPSYEPFVAEYLRAAHVVVDAARIRFPISATRVRENPFAEWEFLDPVVRAFFIKTVCVFGPESCGKSTLCERLAAHFRTIWQPEFARGYLGERHCTYDDMEIIAEGHLSERRKLKPAANKVFLVDTDTVTTRIYSRHYFGGRCPIRVDEMIDLPDNRNDLYLLLTPEVPWVADTSRDLGAREMREHLFQLHENELKSRGLKYVIISGPEWDRRFKMATAAIDFHLFGRNPA